MCSFVSFSSSVLSASPSYSSNHSVFLCLILLPIVIVHSPRSCCCCPVDSKQIWISNTQLLNLAIPKASDFFKSVPAARGLLTMPAQEPSSRGSYYMTPDQPTFPDFAGKKMSLKITSNICLLDYPQMGPM